MPSLKLIRDEKSEFLFENTDTADVHMMAWTTTPWTLPSNTALAVGKEITYVRVRSFNPYSGEPITVILAKDLLNSMFPEANAALEFSEYKAGDKKIPFKVLDEFQGDDLEGINYEQLIDWVNPGEGAFRVLTGDFVTTEDGTGIVHIAPTFGADDYQVAKENGIPPLIVKRKDGTMGPMVDKRGYMVPIADLDEIICQTVALT